MGLAETFKMLQSIGGPLANETACAALADSQLVAQKAALHHFISLSDRRGLTLAVSRFHQLSPEILTRLGEESRPLISVLRDLLTDRVEQTRLNALNWLALLDRADSLVLIGPAFQDASPAIRKRVTEIVRTLTDACSRIPPDASAPAAALIETKRRVLIDVLTHAFRSYDVHREQDVLQCLINLGTPGHDLLKSALAATGGVRRADLLAMLELQTSAALVAFLFRALRDATDLVRRTCESIFERRMEPEFGATLLAHLKALDPMSRSQLAESTNRAPWWAAIRPLLETTPAPLPTRLAEFLEQSRLGARERLPYMTDLVRSPDLDARAFALRHFEAMATPESAEQMIAASQSPAEEVQAFVLDWVLRSTSADTRRLLTAFLTSPHDAVRHRASAELAKESFQRYLKSFDHLDPQTRALAGKAIAKIDEQMVQRLTDELQSLDQGRRLRALRIIEITSKERDVGSVLMELINDSDRKVRATVLGALGMVGTIDAIKALMGALSDPDRRTRANAIEAFEDIGNPRLSALLLPFLKDPDNRVRANAAKALWNFGIPEAQGALIEMLHDPQESMRLSAVWAIGEVRFPGFESLLAEAMQFDLSAGVRRKAEDLLRGLSKE